MRRAHSVIIWLALLSMSCSPGEEPAPPVDSAGGTASPGIYPDSVAACFTTRSSVLARTPGSDGAPPTLAGWIRLEHFDADSGAATLVDSDGFTLEAGWRRRADSVLIAGSSDFVRIEMRLQFTDSSARGTLSARSDAALERDSTGTLREFRRNVTVAFRRVPCDAMPKPAGTAAIDVLPHGTPRPGIGFDPEKLRPGTNVGALTLDTIASHRTVVDSTRAGMARFRGEIALSGWTLRNPDPDLYRQLTCFEADSSSAARLPRWQGDERRAWFCFSNREDAARALGPPSEGIPATIVIDEFTIHAGFSDEVNSARFVRLLRRGPS